MEDVFVDHDYDLAPSLDCIIYFVTGFNLIKLDIFTYKFTIIRSYHILIYKNYNETFHSNFIDIQKQILIQDKPKVYNFQLHKFLLFDILFFF